ARRAPLDQKDRQPCVRPAYQALAPPPPRCRSCDTEERVPSVSKLYRTAVVALAAALPAASPAHGDILDPSMPRTIIVGAPRGAAPSERLDPHRSGRARTHLPRAPVEIWRRHVSGNIDVSPVIDEGGDVVVSLTIPELVKLGPDARELWRVRLG